MGKKGKKKKKEAPPPVEEAPPEQDYMDDLGDMEFIQPETELVVPENQLQLSDVELAQEHTRTLTDKDPNVADNHVKWNFKSRAYAEEPPVSGAMIAVHYSVPGHQLHVDSEEAKAQQHWVDEKRESILEELRAGAAGRSARAGRFDARAGGNARRGPRALKFRGTTTTSPMLDKRGARHGRRRRAARFK